MYKRSLLKTIVMAASNWYRCRLESNKLSRWLKGGIIDLRPGVSHPAPYHLVWIFISAARTHVDEILFVNRCLPGIRAVEKHPDFWKPDTGAAWDDYRHMIAQPGSGIDDDTDYLLKHRDFSRYEVYYVSCGTPSVVHTYRESWFEDWFAILQENLTRTYHFKIIQALGDSHDIRENGCIIHPMGYRPGGIYFIPIEYRMGLGEE